MDWLIPLLGGLGIGSAFTAIISKLIDHFITRKAAKQSLFYKEKREAYLGLLDALHKAAVQPSDENAKNFALWQTRVDVFGTDEVAQAVQGIVDTNDPSMRPKRNKYFKKLIEEMKKDLKENS